MSICAGAARQCSAINIFRPWAGQIIRHWLSDLLASSLRTLRTPIESSRDSCNSCSCKNGPIWCSLVTGDYWLAPSNTLLCPAAAAQSGIKDGAGENQRTSYILQKYLHHNTVRKPAWKAWGCEICLPLINFPGLTEPYWTLLDLTGFYFALMDLTGLYWSLLGLTGPY